VPDNLLKLSKRVGNARPLEKTLKTPVARALTGRVKESS